MSYQVPAGPVHVLTHDDATEIPDALVAPSCNVIEAASIIEQLAERVRVTTQALHESGHFDSQGHWSHCPHRACYDNAQLLRRIGL